MILNDVKTIVDSLEEFIELPDGIERLRKAVLTLAISGKLVAQDPAEGTGEELYEEIQKTRQSEAFVISKKKAYSMKEISLENASFEIPKTWKWTSLGSIYQINPRNILDDVSVSFLPMAKIHAAWAHPIDIGEARSWKEVKTGFTHIAEMDVVLAKITPCFENGKSAVARGLIGGHAAGTTELHVFRDSSKKMDPEYLLCLLKTDAFLKNGELHMTGSAGQKRVPTDYLAQYLIPLPPISEQNRIVRRVNEIMERLSVLEARKQERDEVRRRLTRSAMYSLGLGDTRIALQNLQELVKNPNDIKELEKCILSLAVSGKLAPQDDSDVHIKEQLELSDQARIATAKNDHRADTESLALLSADERWSIPPSWEWRALADLVLFVDYRGKTPTKTERGVRLITAKNIKKGFISLSPEEFLSEADYPSWMTRGIPEIGDILFTTEAPMGNAAVVHFSERFALAQRIICFHPYGAINQDFLVLQLLADSFQSILNKEGTGMTAKGIKASKLKRLPIAIPPLAEQERIVKKVESIMELIRSLQSVLSS